MLKEVSREVNGEELFLGTHAGDVPEGDVRLTDGKLTLAEHDAVDTWRKRYMVRRADMNLDRHKDGQKDVH